MQNTKKLQNIRLYEKKLSSATVRNTTTVTPEVAAIAFVASTAQDYVTVLSGSQEEFRRYLQDRITPTGVRILHAHCKFPDINFIWETSHADLTDNNAAHTAACEYACQLVSDRPPRCADIPLTR